MLSLRRSIPMLYPPRRRRRLNHIKLTPVVDRTAATGNDNDDNKDRGGRRGDARSSTSLPVSLIETYFKLFKVAVRVDDTASSKLSKLYKSKSRPPPSSSGASSSDEASKLTRGRLLCALLRGVN